MIEKTRKEIGRFSGLEDFTLFAKDNLNFPKGFPFEEIKSFVKEKYEIDLKGESLEKIIEELNKEGISLYEFPEQIDWIKSILEETAGIYEVEFDENTSNFIIYEITPQEFDPRHFSHVFFPNWFEKEHFEEILGRSLTNKEFNNLKNYLENTGLADKISEILHDFIHFADEELSKNK